MKREVEKIGLVENKAHWQEAWMESTFEFLPSAERSNSTSEDQGVLVLNMDNGSPIDFKNLKSTNVSSVPTKNVSSII